MVNVKHISKNYNKRRILVDVSFQVQPGEQIAIVGRNGCGKSTLMQVLAGIIKPDSGEISYCSQNMLHNQKLFQKYCGYLPQENPLMEELNVQDNISLWSGKKGRPDENLIKMFELEDILKTRVTKLSGGMKRRVSIACAVVNSPSILLMDEPTTALDLYYQKVIHNWMKEYRRQNGIIILTTHDQTEISESSRCLLLSDGYIDMYHHEFDDEESKCDLR